jgi:hypothetical protein
MMRDALLKLDKDFEENRRRGIYSTSSSDDNVKVGAVSGSPTLPPETSPKREEKGFSLKGLARNVQKTSEGNGLRGGN